MITVSEFIMLLSDDMSWTEGEDFGSGEVLLRKNCARIIHRYLQKVLRESDETEDLPTVADIPDISDCRICAPHIVQVIAKGIMLPEQKGRIELFEGNRKVERTEAEKLADMIAARA